MTSGGTVGTIAGQIRIDAKQAIAEYAALRVANATTRTALVSASSVFLKVGATALLAAAPIVLLFKKAVDSAAQFQKKLDYFGAVTGATQADMDAVAKKAIEMSKTSIYSANQMADAFVEFGKAGIATKDILNGVAEATVNLAQAGDLNIADAAKVIISTMSTFQISAKGSVKIADELAGAANASIIDVSDLATSLKYAGGIAAATKIPFTSVITALSLLGKAGIRGSTAGTSLRQIMVSLTAQTSAAHKEMEKLGLITKKGTNLFIDQAGHLKPLDQIFQLLKEHTSKLTDAQRLAATKTLFNSRALASANILLRDGAAGFKAMNAEITKTSAADVAHKRLDNLAGDMAHLKNSIQTLLIQAGGPLQKMLRGVVQGITSLVRWFGNLSPHTQKLILQILAAVAAFLLITGTIGIMIGTVLRVVKVWKDVALAFKLLKGFILPVITAFRALGITLLANPIFLIIAAIVVFIAIIVLLWFKCKAFRDFMKKVFADIKAWAIDFWHALETAFHAVVNAVVAAWHGIDNAFNAVINAFKTAYNAVVNFFKSIYNAVIGPVKAVINFIKVHWKAIIAILLGPVGLAIDAITTHWKWLVKTTKSFFNEIWKFLKLIWHTIYTQIKFELDLIIKVFKIVWGAIHAYISFIVNLTKTVVLAVWHALSAALSFLWRGLKTEASAVWTAIKWAILTPIHLVESSMRAIWNVIGGTVTSAWNHIYGFIRGIWNSIYSTVTSIGGKIIGYFSKAITWLVRAGYNIIKGLWNGLSNTISIVVSFIAGIGWRVITAIGDAGSWLLGVGKSIIQGLWNGISSLGGWLWDQAKKYLSDFKDKVLGFFGIKSPSKMFHWVGQMMVLGLSNGITKNQHHAVKAITNLNRAIQKAQITSLGATGGVNISSLSSLAGVLAVSQRSGNGGASSTINHGPAVNIEHLEMKGYQPERASDALPRAIRKLNYISAAPRA